MAVKKGARSSQSPAQAAGSAAAIQTPGDPEPQRSGRKLSRSERAVIVAMIAEAEAMRRRLNAGR